MRVVTIVARFVLLSLCGIGAVVSLAVLAGCDPGRNLTYVNQTQNEITIFRGEREIVTLAPGGEKVSGIIQYPGTVSYRALLPDGAVIFSRTLSWNDLKAL